MYKLKQIPEDFIVEELSRIKPNKETGRFTYFLLKKKNCNTLDALRLISKQLKLPLKKFSFAGNKDKIAITTQLCSIEGVGKRIETVKIPNITLTYLGQGNTPVSLGNLQGNYFKITVRNIEKIPKPITEFINYFGEQRFSKNNAEIGKAIIQKDFEKACSLVDQYAVQDFLQDNPTNYIEALRKLPKKLLRLYIHSYQSLLWNKAVANLEKLPKEFPIIGFGTETDEYKQILEEEKLTQRDFIIKSIPEISAEGGKRTIKAEVKNLIMEKLDSNTFKISFFLKKGCYATEFIKQLFR